MGSYTDLVTELTNFLAWLEPFAVGVLYTLAALLVARVLISWFRSAKHTS